MRRVACMLHSETGRIGGRVGRAGRSRCHPLRPLPRSRLSCPMKPLIIAIDGPSGAGKGTVARAIAAALGYRHVDSGAMYRAVAWKAIRDNVALDDEDAVANVADRSRIETTESGVTVNGEVI